LTVTFSVAGLGAKVALTVSSPDIVTEQVGCVPEHAPPQDFNTKPSFGSA
jgi:hypothetical protein